MAGEFLRSFLEGQPAKNIRLVAARGLAPLPPGEILQLLVHLLGDPEPDVAAEAERSLAGWAEEEVLVEIQSPACVPAVLEYFASSNSSTAILDALILNPATPAKSIAQLATRVSGPLLEAILFNRVRLIEAPEILTNIRLNPIMTPGIRRLVEEIESEFFTSKKSAYSVALPVEEGATQPEASDFQEELAEIDLSLEGLPLDPEAREGALLERFARMTVRQKIQTAVFGTREERGILIRDTNKEVARSVLRSPKLAENEVEAFASMRNVSDEVLREIGSSREWTRKYNVVQNLVRNPRTPPAISQRMLFRLHSKDLALIARDRGIPEIVRREAQRALVRRTAPRSPR